MQDIGRKQQLNLTSLKNTHLQYLRTMDSAVTPHRSTTYVDAVCCYRRSSIVVCLSVCLYVCRHVYHDREPSKTAEPIEMPFWLWTRVASGNHVLDGGPDLPMLRAILKGKGRPIVKYRDSRYRELWKNGLTAFEMSFGIWTRVGPRKHLLDGVHIGATWWIRLNRPCAAAMRAFCQITLTTCY